MSQLESARGRDIVFYDGVCLFCDHSVQFLYRHDRRGQLSFATLQGALARRILNAPALPAERDHLSGVLFVTDFATGFERIHKRSSAVLQILHRMGGLWKVLSFLRVVPRFIRDPLYDWFARNRYRWFGKKRRASCFLPPRGDLQRFFE